MSAFQEFCLIALLLYLWESVWWHPLGQFGVCFSRKKYLSGVIDPRNWFSTKSHGLLPMPLVPGSGSRVPCQVLPLLVDPEGRWLFISTSGNAIKIVEPSWADIRLESNKFIVGSCECMVSSPRVFYALIKCRNRGMNTREAVRSVWRQSLSPYRAMREKRKWDLAVSSLRWFQPLLAGAFIFGLVVYQIQGKEFRAWVMLVWLFAMMVLIGAHVIWLSRKVYPECGSALFGDALLCFIVPFHAMRAAEMSARHAFGTTHPMAFFLNHNSTHPWMSLQLRQLAFPRPRNACDEIISAAMRDFISPHLSRCGMTWELADSAPANNETEAGKWYCPRCHSIFERDVCGCRDCQNMPLRQI